jgi:hypothetical protein
VIPRPIFKIFAFLLLPALPIAALWLWFHYAAEPKGYYLSYRSGFLYERLLLPPLPRSPWSTPEPEHYQLLGVQCDRQLCLATPATYAAKVPTMDITQYVPRAVVRAQLDQHVYHGSGIGTLLSVLVPAFAVWFCLFICAAILDYKRHQRMLNGIQILGRWPVPAWRFSGIWHRPCDTRIQTERLSR